MSSTGTLPDDDDTPREVIECGRDSGPITSLWCSAIACITAFSSSRTLPGHA